MKRKSIHWIHWMKLLPVLCGLPLVSLGTVFLLSSLVIGRQVGNQCRSAISRYRGDCVTALVATVADDSRPFRDRNSAIWALGQLGDRRALPYLRLLYTGSVPERESYDGILSQYELKKAIALLEGGFNISAVVWRH